ncbi:MAG: Mg2 transporter protein CorA family protein [Parcubacteria group bacterium GW2011_GWA2_51_12]|nr:MAG: Mg2 transporter protein CorA family protein [Parcubacteria group bacterium GW2011_GWA2_51_12]
MKFEELKHNGKRWINITEPDGEMVSFLKDNFHFHPLNLEDIVSKVGYPKVDAYQDYLFIILQFPIYESDRRIYRRDELDIFLGHDYLITINSGALTALQNFFETCKLDELAREKFMGRGVPLLLYEIMDSMHDYVFPIINQKNDLIFALEEEIYETPELKDMIQEIMILKRNIINIRRILAPQRPVILELQNKHPAFIPQELNIYFDDVLDKKDKIVNQLDTALDYVEVLEQTNEALINRSTNKVIKVLAIFSVIPLPLQMIINYYGMNVSLPYQNQPHILLYINIALIATGAIMVGILIKKRWL